MSASAAVDDAVRALEQGGVAIVATDTVYGLVALPSAPAAVARIYELKARPAGMPLALLAADVEALLGALPDLDTDARRAIEDLLPGPYTLVVRASGALAAALGDASAQTLGVRVPVLPPAAHEVISQTGPVASTSANLHGAPDAAQLAEITDALRERVSTIVDAGALPGTPSTVVDISGPEQRVLREGAVPATQVLAALRRESA